MTFRKNGYPTKDVKKKKRKEKEKKDRRRKGVKKDVPYCLENWFMRHRVKMLRGLVANIRPGIIPATRQ